MSLGLNCSISSQSSCLTRVKTCLPNRGTACKSRLPEFPRGECPWYWLPSDLLSLHRNLPRAIFISIPLVTFVYVFANIAYVTAMSPQELLASNAVAVVRNRSGSPTQSANMDLPV